MVMLSQGKHKSPLTQSYHCRATNTVEAYKLFRELVANYTTEGDDSPFTQMALDGYKGKSVYKRGKASRMT